jgi:hypothetical protein
MNKNQLKNDKAWADKNREHKRYLSKRSTARSFINIDATVNDLWDLKNRIEEKSELLMAEEHGELYIFSNDPQAPIKEIDVQHSMSLSFYLNPQVALIPEEQWGFGSEFPRIDVEELKKKYPDYHFIHVLKFTGQSSGNNDEDDAIYKLSHKEFNLLGKRQRC